MVFVELRTVFLFAYICFVIWSLFRWAFFPARETSLRSRLGSAGLVAGSSSAILLAVFYSYVWMAHELPAHGLNLWVMLLFGVGLGVAGVILGSLGTGWVRRSAFPISLVAIFQWGRPSAGRGPINLVDGLMFASLGLFGLVLIANRYLRSRHATL
jgi:hypothetical protein